MKLAGLGMALLTLAIVGIQFACNKWIRKVTNTYWFWLGIGIFYITYCIAVCWAAYFKHFAQLELPTGRDLTAAESSIVTNALLLNLCPFLNFALSATLIADPSRKATRALAPFAIIASCFVLFLDIPMSSQTEFTLRYIFIGRPTRVDLYYFGHAMNLFIAIGVLLNTPKFGWKGTVATYSALLGFYIYVIICSRITGATCSVSGLHPNDFTLEGNYNIFAKVGLNPIASMCLYFPFFFASIFGVIVLADYCKRGYLAYGDKFSGCWWHWYDYNKTLNKEPWGYFSHQWQLNHKHRR